MKEKTDLRVIKTKKALTETMMQSLQKKSFEEITVQYLCDTAMVRRATFYTHFADKYELFSYTVRCQYLKFPSFQQFEATESVKDAYFHLIEDAVDFLVENMGIFRAVMNSQTYYIILDIIRSEMERDLLPLIEKSLYANSISDLSPKLIFNFHLHGIFGSFLWWVREDYPITKKELVVQIQRMVHIG